MKLVFILLQYHVIMSMYHDHIPISTFTSLCIVQFSCQVPIKIFWKLMSSMQGKDVVVHDQYALFYSRQYYYHTAHKINIMLADATSGSHGANKMSLSKSSSITRTLSPAKMEFIVKSEQCRFSHPLLQQSHSTSCRYAHHIRQE